jgi:hypothetical protein
MIDSGNGAAGYAWEVDTVDEGQWCRLIEEFDDANIYQTWSYGEVRFGRGNMSHLLLREKGEIVAVAQAGIGEIFRRTRGARIGPPSAIRWGNGVAEGNSR